MKMRVLTATLLAVALAVPAMAFNVEWHGDFNNRFAYSDNAPATFTNTGLSGEGYANNYFNETNNGAAIAPKSFKDQQNDWFGELKYRMWLTAQDDDKKVKGTVAFEFGALKYGQDGAAGFAGDSKTVTELRWAFTDFNLPFDEATRAYMGLMPVGYNKFLFNDNAAGVKLVRKSGDFSYSLGWFRNDVSTTFSSATKLADDDLYGADITWGAKDMPKLNAFVLYMEEGKEATNTAPVVNYMDQQLWYGLAVEGQAGPIFYGGTFIKEDGAITPDGNNGDLDRDAYLANLEGTAKLDQLRLKLGWLYASGDDDPNDGDAENYSNIDSYMGGFGSVVVFDSYADDNTMVTSPYIQDKGLNMIYAGVDFDLTDKASVGGSYLWINTAEDFYGDKAVGNEFTVRGSYKITKNLSAGLEAGFLVCGDALDGSTQAAVGSDADDIFRTDASVRLKF